MKIEVLKEQIEAQKVTDDCIIFLNSENSFLANQYVNKIAEIKKKDISYISDLSSVVQTTSFIWGDEDIDDSLRVFHTEEIEKLDYDICSVKNLIIITDKIKEEDSIEHFASYIVKVPKLVAWQVKDYTYSMANGADETDLDLLYSLYGKDIYRLHTELCKLNIFSESERKYLLKDLIKEGAFNDVSTNGVFNFSNALVAKDTKSLSVMMQELDLMDVNNFGLLTILINNFRKYIMVRLNSAPTPENTGLEAKQIYAIGKASSSLSTEQIVKIFQILTDIDRQIKTGELPADMMIDYMIVKILTA